MGTNDSAVSLRARLGLRALWLAHGLGAFGSNVEPAEADPLASAGILTSVLRLPPAVAEALTSSLHELRAIQPDHYWYPPESVHVTLADATAMADPGRAISDLEELAPSLRATAAVVIGLGLTKRSAFVAIAPSRSMRRARAVLRRRWSKPYRPGVKSRVASQMWHANVVRFRHEPSAEFVKCLRSLSVTSGTPISLPALELVRTNRVMSPQRTSILLRIELDPGP